jgi:hypothetical protein
MKERDARAVVSSALAQLKEWGAMPQHVPWGIGVDQEERMARNDYLDEFGKLLMRRVRDYSLSQIASMISGRLRGPDLARFGDERDAAALTAEQWAFVRSVVIDTVDETIHNVLAMIEEETTVGRVRVLFTPKSDQQMFEIEGCSDGLSAEPQRRGGWIARFSEWPMGRAADWFDQNNTDTELDQDDESQ